MIACTPGASMRIDQNSDAQNKRALICPEAYSYVPLDFVHKKSWRNL